MKIYTTTLKSGITRTKEFEKKKLAQFSINVGTRCGHQCIYCSTPSMLRMHKSFRQVGESPFGHGYSIVDPSTPKRVRLDAQKIHQRGMIQLCTTVDAWAPEAQKYNLGRECLEAVLSQNGWTIRILTKNDAVLRDFDLIAKHKSRVLIGASITAIPEKQNVISLIEPYASLIEERMTILREAHARGLRTYGMFCPLLPGIADFPKHIDQLVRFASEVRAEEVFVEPVNPRGQGLKTMQEILKSKGYHFEAAHIESIRNKEDWSWYVTRLIKNTQKSMCKFYNIQRLRFLLYPSRLTTQDFASIKKNDKGVVWLGKG
jgi:DNA repair photolyase